MNEPVIPSHLGAPAKEESVLASIELSAEREIDTAKLNELARVGGYVVNADRLKVLRDFGCAAEQLGALRIMKGSIVLTLDGLTRAMTAAQQVVDDETGAYKLKEKLEAAKVIGYLGNTLSKVTTGAVKMDRDVAEVVMEADQRRRNSFAPGQKVVRQAVQP